MPDDLLKPGQSAPQSGQYEITGPRGGKVAGGPEVTAVEGKPLPPTPEPGQKFRLVDPTNHPRRR
jgi:hypothetical protein